MPYNYYVNKTSSTSADTLLAVGFASLLRNTLVGLDKEHLGIIIHDIGDSYQITLPTPISENDLQLVSPFALIKPLVSTKQAEKQAKHNRNLDGFPYEE